MHLMDGRQDKRRNAEGPIRPCPSAEHTRHVCSFDNTDQAATTPCPVKSPSCRARSTIARTPPTLLLRLLLPPPPPPRATARHLPRRPCQQPAKVKTPKLSLTPRPSPAAFLFRPPPLRRPAGLPSPSAHSASASATAWRPGRAKVRAAPVWQWY